MNDKDREEFTLMKADVIHTKNSVKEIKEDVSSIDKTMTKISLALFSDKDTDSDGIIKLTKRNGIRLTKLENIKIAMLFIYGSIWAVLGWFIKSRF